MKAVVRFLLLLTVLFTVDAYAYASFGDVAENLLGPTAAIAQLMHAFCYIAGLGFLLGGTLQVKNYKDNPQQVRISTPITLLLLGVALLALPNLSMMSNSAFFIS